MTEWDLLEQHLEETAEAEAERRVQELQAEIKYHKFITELYSGREAAMSLLEPDSI